MIRTGTRIALEVIIGLMAVAALLVGVALWRLSSGPVQLEFLTPRIERALSDPRGGYTVRVGATELTWGGWARTVDLHARNLTVFSAEEEVVAVLPDVVVRLSLRALAQGTLAPTAVEVIGARIRLVRESDGTFVFGPWAEAQSGTDTGGDAVQADVSAILPSILDQLMSHPKASEPLSFLTSVRILGARMYIDDRLRRVAWEAPYADIELTRDRAGLAGRVDLILALAGSEANVAAQFVYDRAQRRSRVTLRFTDLLPAALVSFAPRLAPIARLDIPLEGEVEGQIGLDGTVARMTFAVRGRSGMLQWGGKDQPPLAVHALEVRGGTSRDGHELKIETARLVLGEDGNNGPKLEVSGTLTSARPRFVGDLEVDLTLDAEAVPAAQLGRYWRPEWASNARRWVLKNVPRGVVEHAAARVMVAVPDGAFARAEVRTLSGTMRYRDLEVHYLRPMPPVTGIAGTAEFDGTSIEFTPQSGTLGALKVHSGTVRIIDLDTSNETMAIDVAVTGPLRAALKLLDHDRLGLIRRLGFDPASAGGMMAARLDMRFPLINDLDLDQIDLEARANLNDVRLADFLMGRDVTQGTFKLEVDKTKMALTGPLRLAGVPMEIDWVESFQPSVPRRTRLELRIPAIDAAGRAAFGLDLAPYLEGPVSANIVALRDRDGQDTLEAALNLSTAHMAIAPLAWEKPSGVEGRAFITFALEDERLAALRSFEIEAGTLFARGSGELAPGTGALQALRLERITFNDSDLRDVAVKFAEDSIDVRVGGGVLDATAWLDVDVDASVDASRRSQTQTATAPPPGIPAPPHASFMPLRLSASHLDAVYFGSDRFFEAVSLEVQRSRRGWERVALRGQVPRSLWYRRGSKAGSAKAAEEPEASAAAKTASRTAS
ncbi:MAG: hypothetical protein D6826_03455, partial [Alphaproteobacteria bacterium]